MTMFAPASKEVSVKYTTVLPKACSDEMKGKRAAYASSLKDATSDNAFIKRTMDAQNDFEL